VETGSSRQDKTVLTCRQFCLHRRNGQDKTVLSRPCRRCEIAIRYTQQAAGGNVYSLNSSPHARVAENSHSKKTHSVIRTATKRIGYDVTKSSASRYRAINRYRPYAQAANCCCYSVLLAIVAKMFDELESQ